MERRIPCPSNAKDCKYAPSCHTSEHHVYPRRTADTKLERAFGNLGINKIISCRMIHDILDTFPPPAYPEEDVMRDTFETERGRPFRD